MVLMVSPLGSAIRLSVFCWPDALLVVVGDEHRAAVGRGGRFVRPAHDRHVPIRLHRLQVDQRDRVGLLVHRDDGAREVDAARRRLRGEWRQARSQGQNGDPNEPLSLCNLRHLRPRCLCHLRL